MLLHHVNALRCCLCALLRAASCSHLVRIMHTYVSMVARTRAFVLCALAPLSCSCTGWQHARLARCQRAAEAAAAAAAEGEATAAAAKAGEETAAAGKRRRDSRIDALAQARPLAHLDLAWTPFRQRAQSAGGGGREPEGEGGTEKTAQAPARSKWPQ